MGGGEASFIYDVHRGIRQAGSTMSFSNCVTITTTTLDQVQNWHIYKSTISPALTDEPNTKQCSTLEGECFVDCHHRLRLYRPEGAQNPAH